jgi:hypothetical protein
MSGLDFLNEIAGLFPNQSPDHNDNRFAFLATTSKCELALRDEIAFRLQRKYLEPQNAPAFFPGAFYISREWEKRYDLAILKPTGEAACIVEFKAVATADKIKDHAAEIRKDFEKLVNDPEIAEAQKYVILVVMLPEGKFADPVVAVMKKYLQRINRQFESGRKPDGQKYFDEDWKRLLKGQGIKTTDPEGVRRITIDAGSYAGTGIKLDLFTAGPLVK